MLYIFNLIECNLAFYHFITLLQNEAIHVNTIVAMLLHDINKLKNNKVCIYINIYLV